MNVSLYFLFRLGFTHKHFPLASALQHDNSYSYKNELCKYLKMYMLLTTINCVIILNINLSSPFTLVKLYYVAN